MKVVLFLVCAFILVIQSTETDAVSIAEKTLRERTGKSTFKLVRRGAETSDDGIISEQQSKSQADRDLGQGEDGSEDDNGADTVESHEVGNTRQKRQSSCEITYVRCGFWGWKRCPKYVCIQVGSAAPPTVQPGNKK